MQSIVHSEITILKKSKFQAHYVPLHHKSEIPEILNILQDDKNIRKSTHPHMYAYIVNSHIGDVGFSDCGESGAGSRMLTLLQNMKLENVMVIVTRWYGGTPLGSARFRIISGVVVEVLKKAKVI
ncbi:hypothetical protein WICPIJ_004980 [Wickerhamomyces pijperi]|uniref:Impact N-terminal domain-containing protein n=1 Tax=Wickerhamomyces pijperi TaxID=599730 RepID=A0A9P8Q6M0_WICPI|nr:hypothetical protein WICPIJ_004980 [Wickerhamomyces pijperi]